MPDWMKEACRAVAIIAVMSFIFAWLSVYNTGQMAFLPRLGFWAATMTVGYGGGYLFIPLVREGLKHLPMPVQIGSLAALISIPVTLLLMIISSDPWSFQKFAIQFVYVFVISLVLTLINWFTDDLRKLTAQGTPDADPVMRFMQRLPVKYRTAQLYAVSAEDHYLRVHTSLGEALILMRLADAIKESEGVAGLQTQRSWWVAEAGVSDAERRQGKQILILKSGAEAAVSRTFAGAVKAARFF